MKKMRRLSLVSLLWIASVLVAPRVASASIFDGDPIDPATGLARVLLPGVPLVHPGPDEKYGDGDDVFDTSIVGDVDLVLRTGGTFGGGAFPPPASGIAFAPVVGTGGGTLGGTEVVFDVIASDGATSPPGGNPLSAVDLDGRAALVFAFADLDGDGFIGPTSADGSVDDEIERQEVLSPIGRQVAVFLAGVAHGSLGVSLGAPASAGGLGVVLVAGAATGAVPPVYTDGPWAATLLPFLPSTDPARILHGNPRAADPDYLADVEIEMDSDRHFVPRADHPVIGTPFAIPLDGTSVTVDLARGEAGPAVSAGLGLPVEAATFVAAPQRLLRPAVDPSGTGRALVDATTPVSLADDGPGGGVTLYVFAADLLGNASDPTAPLAVTIEGGPGLRVVSPDTDADPSREEIEIGSAASIPFVLDDSGGVGDDPATSRVFVSTDGVPTAALDVILAGGSASGWTRLEVALRRGGAAGNGTIRLTGRFGGDPLVVDPPASELAITMNASGAAAPLYARSLPAGAVTANRAATSFSFADPRNAPAARIGALRITRRAKDPTAHQAKLLVRKLDLSGLDAAIPALDVTFRIGATDMRATLACSANAKGTLTLCVLP